MKGLRILSYIFIVAGCSGMALVLLNALGMDLFGPGPSAYGGAYGGLNSAPLSIPR